MKIHDILHTTHPVFSFEFFPPKTEDQQRQLLETIRRLGPLSPAYVSVTYGAGGSTRALTIDTVNRIKGEFGIDAMAHLTCVGASRDEIRETLDTLASHGVENVMALRGDPPKGTKDFQPAPDGFAHASDLIQFINENYDFSIGGACYPEGHFEGNTGKRQDPDLDLEHLFKKVKAGAKFLVTQLFYDNEAYFHFVERARMFGIEVPIIPGLMPVVNAESIPRIAKMSGASFPESLMREVQARGADPDAVVELAVAFTALQADELLRHGAPGIHFYTLNRSPATSAIVSALRLIRPWEVRNYT